MSTEAPRPEEIYVSAKEKLSADKAKVNIARMQANQDGYEAVDPGGNEVIAGANDFDALYKAAQAEARAETDGKEAQIIQLRPDAENDKSKAA